MRQAHKLADGVTRIHLSPRPLWAATRRRFTFPRKEFCIGIFILLNLFLTFSIAGISIGGHIGGLIGGALAALLVIFVEQRMSGRPGFTLEIVGIVLMIAATFAGALAVAG